MLLILFYSFYYKFNNKNHPLNLQYTQTALGFFIDQRQSPLSHEWSYSNQQDWRMEHKQCGQNVQSPIDIMRRHVITNNQLKLHFYNYNQLTKFKIENAHHTIKLSPIDINQQDNFGFKLRPPGAGSSPNGGDDGFNSSLPDIITADEDSGEPEFEARPPTQSSVAQHYPESNHNNHHHQASGRNQSLRIKLAAASQQQSSQSNHQQHQQQQQQNSRARTLHHEHPTSSVVANQAIDSNNIGSTHEDGVNGDNSLEHQQQPYNGSPTIKLDWLDDGNNEYKLRDIHFHWGERRDNGSEHAIDGRRAAMEMHLVHIKHGLDKSQIGITSDSVTVIAVLIESYRKSNADFNPIVNALSRINMTNMAQEIEYKSINDLLPNILTSFYTYSGSLTTPPCYQVVNWIVMSDRLYLNAKQIEMFRNLYAPPSGHQQHHAPASYDANEQRESTSKLIIPNIRQLQPLNNRTILASFSPLSRLEQIQVISSPYNSASSIMSQKRANMLLKSPLFIFFNTFQSGSLVLVWAITAINIMIITIMHSSCYSKTAAPSRR